MTVDSSKIARLDYHPPGRNLDLEIFRVSQLRQRVSKQQMQTCHRYDFHLLIFVSHGKPDQLVDFRPVACRSGSVLFVRPGQLHDFGPDMEWDGWMLLFRPEFLRASIGGHPEDYMLDIEGLPDHLLLDARALASVNDSMSRMNADMMAGERLETIHALLKHQLCALLLRLAIFHERSEGASAPLRSGQERFAKFRELLDQKYAVWHQVADYALALSCTERSLTRAALDADGRTAKHVITARIALEAKRLLAHTRLSIQQIAAQLGFAEPTNFSKFFRREANITPADFRRRYRGASGDLPLASSARAPLRGAPDAALIL